MRGFTARRTIVWFVVAGISFALAACGDDRAGRSSTPGAPSVPVPPQPTAIVVSGYVDDTVFQAVPGATVEVLDGPEAGRSVVTDESGKFSLIGDFQPSNRLRATKMGYGMAIRTFPSAMTFFLGVGGISANSATLTVEADPACTELPNNLRKRTYAATIAAEAPAAGNHLFVANLTGASLDSYFRSVQLRVGGDQLMFDLSDNGIEEDIEDEGYLFVGGVGYAVLRAGATTISASLDPGVIDYCVLKSDPGSAYPCTDQSLARVQCQSARNRLTLTWQ